MSAEAIIYATLSGDSAIAAIVDARIYAGRAPQGATMPYVTYERSTTQRNQAINKWLDSPHVRMDVNCWGGRNDYADLVSLSAAIRKAVRAMPKEVGGFRILGKNIENQQGPFWEDESEAYRAIIEPRIRHRED